MGRKDTIMSSHEDEDPSLAEMMQEAQVSSEILNDNENAEIDQVESEEKQKLRGKAAQIPKSLKKRSPRASSPEFDLSMSRITRARAQIMSESLPMAPPDEDQSPHSKSGSDKISDTNEQIKEFEDNEEFLPDQDHFGSPPVSPFGRTFYQDDSLLEANAAAIDESGSVTPPVPLPKRLRKKGDHLEESVEALFNLDENLTAHRNRELQKGLEQVEKEGKSSWYLGNGLYKIPCPIDDLPPKGWDRDLEEWLKFADYVFKDRFLNLKESYQGMTAKDYLWFSPPEISQQAELMNLYCASVNLKISQAESVWDCLAQMTPLEIQLVHLQAQNVLRPDLVTQLLNTASTAEGAFAHLSSFIDKLQEQLTHTARMVETYHDSTVKHLAAINLAKSQQVAEHAAKTIGLPEIKTGVVMRNTKTEFSDAASTVYPPKSKSDRRSVSSVSLAQSEKAAARMRPTADPKTASDQPELTVEEILARINKSEK